MVTLNFRLFHVEDKHFFNPHSDLDLSTFPCGRQKGSLFVNSTLFLPNVMAFLSKKKVMITLIDHIFRNPLILTKILTFCLPHEKLKVQGHRKDFKNIYGKAKNSSHHVEFPKIYDEGGYHLPC